MTMLSQEQRAEYLRHAGARCPFCGSEDIEGNGEHGFDGPEAWAGCECHACGETWTDIYTLSAVEPGFFRN